MRARSYFAKKMLPAVTYGEHFVKEMREVCRKIDSSRVMHVYFSTRNQAIQAFGERYCTDCTPAFEL